MTKEGLPTRYQYQMLTALLILGFLARITPYLADSSLPYGEFDAAYHYQMAKLVSDGWYPRNVSWALNTKGYVGDYTYPPGTHTILAVLKILGFSGNQSFFLSAALLNSLLIASAYMLVKKLFNVESALICASYQAFSFRDIQSIFWGQWSSYAGMLFIPATAYLGVKAAEDKRFTPLWFLLGGYSFSVYPQWSIYAMALSALLFVTQKGSFSKNALVCAIVFFALCAPTYYFMSDYIVGKEVATEDGRGLGQLLSWYPQPRDGEEGIAGYPISWYSIWVYPKALLVSLVFGIYYLFKSRDFKSLGLLNLGLFYVFSKLDIVGVTGYMRAITQYNMEHLVLLFFVPYAFTKTSPKWVKALLTVLAVANLASSAGYYMTHADSIYPPASRVSDAQMRYSQWMRQNLDEDAAVEILGGIPDRSRKWVGALSDRKILEKHDGKYVHNGRVQKKGPDYVVYDYNPYFTDPARAKENTLMLYEKEQENKNQKVYEDDWTAIKKTG